MGRPPGVPGRKQLTAEDIFRCQVLYRDARMGPTEIQRVTGYTLHQVKYALKKKTPTVGIRTGRPRKVAPTSSQNTEREESAQGERGAEAGQQDHILLDQPPTSNADVSQQPQPQQPSLSQAPGWSQGQVPVQSLPPSDQQSLSQPPPAPTVLTQQPYGRIQSQYLQSVPSDQQPPQAALCLGNDVTHPVAGQPPPPPSTLAPMTQTQVPEK